MSTTQRPVAVFFAPVATRSGYGAMARDIVRHFIEYDKFDVQILSVPWGDTPMNALDPMNPHDAMLIDRILTHNLTRQPEVYVHIGVPNEANPIGKFNILCTAGIETTIASAQWIEACNKMDVIFTISEHSKAVFQNSKYGVQDQRGNHQGTVELNKPIEVLHNCIDTTIFGKNAAVDKTLTATLDALPDTFNYLFVGHWLNGDFGEDRKNVALLIKIFLETFKQVTDRPRPALILKTSSAGFSILDRENVLGKIRQIRDTIKLDAGQALPNIYLLHGEFTDEEMNTLYTHPKVKAHVSLTKGEGFGRPLLEASVSGKPVIASGWSGQLDFLDKDRAVLVGGELKQIHPSATWDNVLIKESSWFSPNTQQAADAMAAVFLDHKTFKDRAYPLSVENKKKFSYENIRKKTFELLDKYIPEFPVEVAITLPKLKKIELPKLQKVE